MERPIGFFGNQNLSDEEKIINEAHRAYSNFIYHTAWYEFDFLPWIERVWSVSDTSNSSSLRKWERTILFSTEFLIKAGYAQLLESGEQMMEGEEVNDIYVLIDGKSEVSTQKHLKVIHNDETQKLIAIRRWGPFTETMLKLSDENILINKIGYNDKICVSTISQKDTEVDFKYSTFLFDSRIVTNNNLKRRVYLVSVNNLLPFIQYLKHSEIEVEHVYDY